LIERPDASVESFFDGFVSFFLREGHGPKDMLIFFLAGGGSFLLVSEDLLREERVEPIVENTVFRKF